MFIAAQYEHVEALSVLISAGADLNAANKVSYSNTLAITVSMMSLRVFQHNSVHVSLPHRCSTIMGSR